MPVIGNQNRYIKLAFVLTLGMALMAIPLLAQPGSTTPPNLKLAFVGDQGVGNNAKAVLELIKDEGAEAIVHQGDLDYENDPAAWESLVNDVLGEDYPVFISAGNHDEWEWRGDKGYGKLLEQRLQRSNIPWDGDIGIQSSLTYKGIFIVMIAPAVLDSGHADYLVQQLAANKAVWSIANWHKNMAKMQVGGKTDETGWQVYEEARKGGAIIATGHEHSYSRTHLLSSMSEQIVASTSDTLRISEGKSFAFVSGLGGRSIRDQQRSGDWWASVYTSDQNAEYGALFGVFNRDGNERLAEFYFKNIQGEVIDRFWVVSEVTDVTAGSGEASTVPLHFELLQNYPNPFNPETTIHYYLERPAMIQLVISNLLGQPVRMLIDALVGAGPGSVRWDGKNDKGNFLPGGVYFYTMKNGVEEQTRRMILLK